jgi:hypothetical protein
MEYSDDIDESVFLFERHGRTIYRSPPPFVNDRNTADIHLWDADRDHATFEKDCTISPCVTPLFALRSLLSSRTIGIIKPILHFEFAINTGGKSGFAVANLITIHISALLS